MEQALEGVQSLSPASDDAVLPAIVEDWHAWATRMAGLSAASSAVEGATALWRTAYTSGVAEARYRSGPSYIISWAAADGTHSGCAISGGRPDLLKRC